MLRSMRIIAVALASIAALVLTIPAVYAKDNVTVQLDWVVRGDHAMFFVAKKEGYFAKNGINVSAIRKGSGSMNALRQVGNGNAEFGFGDLPTLAVAHSEGVPVVALAAVNQNSPLAMITLKKKHVLKSPEDLKGLNVGVDPAAGSAYNFFRAFLHANGMSLSDVKISTVSPPYENYLLLGRVDAIPGYIDAEVPVLRSKAGGTGSLSILQGAKYGYNAYGSGVFTSEKLIKSNPGLVRRFMAAYMEAFHYVMNHPKEAAAIIAHYRPEYSSKKDVLIAQLEADIHSTFTSGATKQHGLGWMTAKRWDETVTILHNQGVLKRKVNVKDVYTDKFLPNS